jgi:hypothetical protein
MNTATTDLFLFMTTLSGFAVPVASPSQFLNTQCWLASGIRVTTWSVLKLVPPGETLTFPAVAGSTVMERVLGTWGSKGLVNSRSWQELKRKNVNATKNGVILKDKKRVSLTVMFKI